MAMRISMLLSNPFRPDPSRAERGCIPRVSGHQVTIIAWDRQCDLPAISIPLPGVEVQRIQDIPSGYALGASQLRRLPLFWRKAMRKSNSLSPDIVHCHDFDTLPAGLWWGQRHRISVVYDAHEHYADLVRPRLRGPLGSILYRAIRLAEQWQPVAPRRWSPWTRPSPPATVMLTRTCWWWVTTHRVILPPNRRRYSPDPSWCWYTPGDFQPIVACWITSPCFAYCASGACLRACSWQAPSPPPARQSACASMLPGWRPGWTWWVGYPTTRCPGCSPAPMWDWRCFTRNRVTSPPCR